MKKFQSDFDQVQNAAHEAAAIAFSIWLVSIFVALALAVWIYRDAIARGKLGIVAVILVMLSTAVNFILTICFLLVWILLRPPKKKSVDQSSNRKLPDELGPSIQPTKKTTEFLTDLDIG